MGQVTAPEVCGEPRLGQRDGVTGWAAQALPTAQGLGSSLGGAQGHAWPLQAARAAPCLACGAPGERNRLRAARVHSSAHSSGLGLSLRLSRAAPALGCDSCASFHSAWRSPMAVLAPATAPAPPGPAQQCHPGAARTFPGGNQEAPAIPTPRASRGCGCPQPLCAVCPMWHPHPEGAKLGDWKLEGPPRVSQYPSGVQNPSPGSAALTASSVGQVQASQYPHSSYWGTKGG